mgnify:CR=1 FL=1
MPNGLMLAFAAANARLRAWHGAGVPVVGLWGTTDDGVPRFFVTCLTCHAIRDQICEWRDPVTPENLPGLTTEIVRVLVLAGCFHLAPLLGADSSEVVELTKLELLAGE